MISFICNNENITTCLSSGLNVLSWLREEHGLKGTKEGCREGDCGACTVILGKPSDNGMLYSAVASCLLPIGEMHGNHLVTIEGLNLEKENKLTPFQLAFYNKAASQCGFCTPGMLMSLTGFLLGSSEITEHGAIESLDGNICRCTGYVAVKRAVTEALKKIPENYSTKPRIEMLIKHEYIPEYFSNIQARLARIPEADIKNTGTIIAGGTDIYVRSSDKLANQNPSFLSTSSDKLNYIYKETNRIKIGATVTFNQLRESFIISDLLPQLKEFLAKVSSTQIRQRATVGGNIVNASPIADMAIIFLALNADVTVNGRVIPLEKFYLGYKKLDMQPGEILTEISFPKPPPGSILSSLKVSKRDYLDIASVNSSFLFELNEGKIVYARGAAGGVAPVPLLLKNTSTFLTDKILSEELIQNACRIASEEISPISDVRGSKEYKIELLGAQIKAHLTRGIKL